VKTQKKFCFPRKETGVLMEGSLPSRVHTVIDAFCAIGPPRQSPDTSSIGDESEMLFPMPSPINACPTPISSGVDIFSETQTIPRAYFSKTNSSPTTKTMPYGIRIGQHVVYLHLYIPTPRQMYRHT
jgi:hypothetical protein